MEAAKDKAKERGRMLEMFQELCGCWEELTKSNNEDECLVLVELADQLRRRWQSECEETDRLRTRVVTLEQSQLTSDRQQRALSVQLTDARAQIAALLTQKKGVDAELKALQKDFDRARHVLKSDSITEVERNRLSVFVSRAQSLIERQPSRHSSLSVIEDGDIDYDTTGEQQHTSGNSANAMGATVFGAVGQTSRSVVTKSQEQAQKTHEVVATTTLKVVASGPSTAQLALKQRDTDDRWSEEQRVSVAIPATNNRNDGDAVSVDAAPSWSSGGLSVSSRRHAFAKNSFPLTLIPDHCDVCRKRMPIGKSIYKCLDCQLLCHVACVDRVPCPCVPRALSTPTRLTLTHPQKIADLVPSRPPMIPHIVVHLVTELDHRRNTCDLVQLYSQSEKYSTEKAAEALLHKFLTTRSAPNLAEVHDTATLLGCLLEVLRRLKQPLIPPCSWRELSACVNSTDDDSTSNSALEQAIADLPMPNRDTLAYLILHWQSVITTMHDKMPIDVLARLLRTAVFGRDVGTYMLKLSQKCQVLVALLRLRCDFWSELLDYESCQPLISRLRRGTDTSNTPKMPLSPTSQIMVDRVPPSTSSPICATPQAVFTRKLR